MTSRELRRLTSVEEIHAYWRQTGNAWRIERLPQVRPSPGGTLIVYPVYSTTRSPWTVANHDALRFGVSFYQPGVKRALALADRIEQMRTSKGEPFDWNDKAERNHIHIPGAVLTEDGTPWLQALLDLLDQFNDEQDQQKQKRGRRS